MIYYFTSRNPLRFTNCYELLAFLRSLTEPVFYFDVIENVIVLFFFILRISLSRTFGLFMEYLLYIYIK